MKYLKKFFCYMGWHSYFSGYDDVHGHSNDPYNILKYGKCKWCGFEGQIDSQGNLY